eukprot:1146585-Amphidinium_carterae.1
MIPAMTVNVNAKSKAAQQADLDLLKPLALLPLWIHVLSQANSYCKSSGGLKVPTRSWRSPVLSSQQRGWKMVIWTRQLCLSSLSFGNAASLLHHLNHWEHCNIDSVLCAP